MSSIEYLLIVIDYSIDATSRLRLGRASGCGTLNPRTPTPTTTALPRASIHLTTYEFRLRRAGKSFKRVQVAPVRGSNTYGT